MKPINDFPGYFITEEGNIYSILPRANQKPPKVPRKIATSKSKKGYIVVHLSKNKKMHKRYLHRLLLTAFVRRPENDEQGMHLDGNPLNNSLKNLKWGFHTENQSHRTIHGTDTKGERHGLSKLTEDQVKEIRKLACIKTTNRKNDKGGNYKAIAKKFCVSPSTIARIAQGNGWNHI